MRTLLARLRMFRAPAGCDSGAVRGRESGQAVVETAIVLPLFTFLILGLLQLMLMHQARLMTRYAAYKAARAGALGSANMHRMEMAALSVMIPMIAKSGANGAGHATNALYHVTSGSDIASAFGDLKRNQDDESIKWVEVTICSPNTDLLNDLGDSGDEIDFDAAQGVTGQGWKGFDKTRLSIQVTFNYRMVIPFANMLIWHMAYGNEDMNAYQAERLGFKGRPLSKLAQKERSKYDKGHDQGEYIFPIRANWAMRMHSNLFPNEPGYELPGTNECIVRFPKLGDSSGSGTQDESEGDDVVDDQDTDTSDDGP